MSDSRWLAERFEEQRPHLRTIAYRMLGSVTESDDAVQEAWLRLSRADQAVENLGGWLTTVVGRVCLDMLRARRARREDYVGSWLPEPIVTIDDSPDPEQEALIADSVGLALLVVLETLTPSERLAFVLHDMFAVPFDEIGPLLEPSPAAARQLASRARRRVKGAPAVPETDLARRRRVVAARAGGEPPRHPRRPSPHLQRGREPRAPDRRVGRRHRRLLARLARSHAMGGPRVAHRPSGGARQSRLGRRPGAEACRLPD